MQVLFVGAGFYPARCIPSALPAKREGQSPSPTHYDIAALYAPSTIESAESLAAFAAQSAAIPIGNEIARFHASYFYIFSGAEQPFSVMPFFSTARAVSASFNLASSTFSASPLMRQAL